MMKPHRKLEVWQKAIELTKNVYELTKKMPKEEKYGLSIQMKRCAVSVPSNIAEGVARRGQKEAIQFFSMARASLSELDTQLELCLQLGFITEKEFNEISNLLEKVDSLLNGLLKYRNKLLSLKKCLFIFLPFYLFTLLPFTAYTLPPLVITEVAPGEPGTKDWIEIFVSSSGDYAGWKIESGYPKRLVKVLPSRQYNRGDIIVITMNSQEPDSNEKGVYWMFYSTNTDGLYDSDGILYITDPSGNWVDAVGWSNRDGDMAKDAISVYNSMKQNNMWKEGPDTGIDGTNDKEVQNSLVDWSDGATRDGASIQRYKDFNGMPKDTNSLYDWFYSRSNTKGYGYKEVVSVTQKVVEVDKNTNPFCPEDVNNNFVKINFNIDDSDAKKTIVIYDIKGKEVKKLLDRDMLPNGDITQYSGVKTGSISWDGKLSDGISRAPTGVYIVYFEAYNPATGKKYVGKDVIVVGRKFK